MWKSLVAALGAAVMVLSDKLSDGVITNTEWLQIAVALVAAVQVWYVTNHTAQPYAKSVFAGIAAGLDFLIGVLPDHHLQSSDWVNLLIAVLVAAGVFASPGPIARLVTADTRPTTA